MTEFNEVCKVLINTDNFNKDKSPYVLCTAINLFEQNKFAHTEFNHVKVQERESKYKDVVGFYRTSPPKHFQITPADVETMKQWIKSLEKSLIFLVECEGVLNAWLFTKKDNEIIYTEIKADTSNNVNYYVWTDPTPSFWGNADFLLQGEGYIQEESDDPVSEIIERIENMEACLSSVLAGMDNLTIAVQNLVLTLTKK